MLDHVARDVNCERCCRTHSGSVVARCQMYTSFHVSVLTAAVVVEVAYISSAVA
jgi:hypothetical protein